MLLICLLIINPELIVLYRGKDYVPVLVPNTAYSTKGKYDLATYSGAWKPTNASYMCTTSTLHPQEKIQLPEQFSYWINAYTSYNTSTNYSNTSVSKNLYSPL